jgi:hypothetical protein
MTNQLLATIILNVVSFFIGVVIAASSVQNSWRLDAAATECAQFNPSHGHFEWLIKE